MNEDAPQGLKLWGIFYVKVYYSNKRNGCSPYHNGNIIAEEIPPELLSYMEEVLPEKKELDTEIVLDTMINVNEFLKNECSHHIYNFKFPWYNISYIWVLIRPR